MKSRRRFVTATVLVIALSFGVFHAYGEEQKTLGDLVRAANLIVSGKIGDISTRGPAQVAELSVKEILKGKEGAKKAMVGWHRMRQMTLPVKSGEEGIWFLQSGGADGPSGLPYYWAGERACFQRQSDEIVAGIREYVRIQSVETPSLIEELKAAKEAAKRAPLLEEVSFRKLDEAVPVIAPLLLEEKNEAARAAAVKALGRIGSDAAIDLLDGIIGTNGESPSLREAAMTAIGKGGSDRAVEILVKVLLGPKESAMIPTAIAALGLTKNEKAVAPLVKAYDENDDQEFKKGVVGALGNVGGEKAMDALLDIFKREKKRELRKTVILSLMIDRGERAVDHLIWILDNNSEPDIVVVTTAQLGFLHGNQKVKDALQRAMKDEGKKPLWKYIETTIGRIETTESLLQKRPAGQEKPKREEQPRPEKKEKLKDW